MRIRRRPSTCLYNVSTDGPRMRIRWGRCTVGFTSAKSDSGYEEVSEQATIYDKHAPRPAPGSTRSSRPRRRGQRV